MEDIGKRSRGRGLPSRRTVLAGSAALAMPAIWTSGARAQSSTLVVSTWGGNFGRLLTENVDVPFMKPLGIEVVQDIGGEEARVAKIQAQRMLPQGNIDIACVTGGVAQRLADLGALEPLNAATVPNLAHALPNLLTPTAAPQFYSPQVLIYSSERVKEPPTSFADLLEPAYKNKVGLTDGNFPFNMMAAALYASGNITDVAGAKEAMIRLNKNGLKLYPSVDATAPPFKSGEIDAGIMFLARVISWQDSGIPVKAAFPKEGAALYVSSLVVPKNAPNKQAALKYINAMLEPSAQQGFAAKLGYIPATDNAGLSGTLAQQLALPVPAPKLVVPDYAAMAAGSADLADWWKKTIQRS